MHLNNVPAVDGHAIGLRPWLYFGKRFWWHHL